LADWEKDTWKKVFFKVGQKAVFSYTFDKQMALEKNFPLSVGEIISASIKVPKRANKLFETEAQTSTTNDTKSAKSSREIKRSRTQDPALNKSRKEVSPVSVTPRPRATRLRDEPSIFSFRMFDQDHSNDGGYDSAIDESREPYFMKLFNSQKNEVA